MITSSLKNAVIAALLCIAIFLIAVSVFISSTFLAIVGIALIFWILILSYIKITKNIPSGLFDASANSGLNNIERIVIDQNLTEKGVYLPPKCLRQFDSSLVFIPRNTKFSLPKPEETDVFLSTKGVFITPPGYQLSRKFEENNGISFTLLDFNRLQYSLQNLLINQYQIISSLEIHMHEKSIIFEISSSILDDVCIKADNEPHAHSQVGCLFSSTFACILAKVTGKPISIQSERRKPETSTNIIEFRIEEG